MPRIWAETIDSHRRQVHDAIVDATAELILEQGPTSVSMSAVAERAGIGRATLYKYFPDLASILVAWHTREFRGQLAHLESISDSEAVTLEDLMAFVRRQRDGHHQHRAANVVAALAHAVAGEEAVIPGSVEQEVVQALSSLIGQLARREEIRDDMPPSVLARWLFHAIHAPMEVDTETVVALVGDSLAPGRRASASKRRGARLRR